MVSGDGGNGPLSQDDKENMQTDEVMSIYEKKYGKKTFFEEMWEKNHPEEAKQLHDEEVNKEKMKQEEAQKKKEALAQKVKDDLEAKKKEEEDAKKEKEKAQIEKGLMKMSEDMSENRGDKEPADDTKK